MCGAHVRMENAYISTIMSERKIVLRRWEDNIKIDMV
jgi:hypothetical protein